MIRRRALGLIGVVLVVAACAGAAVTAPPADQPSATSASSSPPSPVGSVSPSRLASPEASIMPSPGPFSLTSPAFSEGGPIPVASTCHGDDASPELAWSGVPDGTMALVLFVDDPDGHDWVHWSVIDLAPDSTGLPAGVSPSADPPRQGTNDFGKVGYGGPCPPSGTHHYRFTLSALATPLGLSGHPDGRAVRAALAQASVIGSVTLTGTFHA